MHPNASQQTDEHTAVFVFTLVAAFFLSAGYVISTHEMWLDEIQAWLIARDSATIFDLFHNLRYEGHPGLWHLLLMPLTRIFRTVESMQALHLLISTGIVYTFARYAPFSRLVKSLFAFGYFTFYEYTILSRNYSIGILFLFIFCALFKHRYTNFILVGCILFLLCHTNALALILVIVLFGVLLAEYILTQGQLRAKNTAAHVRITLGFAIILLGICTSAYQLVPPADSGFAVGWSFTPQLNLLRRIATEALFPLPKPEFRFWGTTVWGGNYSTIFFSLFTLAFFGLFTFKIARKPVALAIFAGGALALLTFFIVKHTGCIRHHGYIYIIFFASYWIAHSCADVDWCPGIPAFKNRCNKLFHFSLVFILVLQVAGAAVAGVIDVRYCFSRAKDIAAYLEKNNLSQQLLVAFPDDRAVPVLGYLNKDKAYCVARKAFGSYAIWDKDLATKLSHSQVITAAQHLSAQYNQDVLLLFARPLSAADEHSADLAYMASFTEAIEWGEEYHLYWLRKSPEADPPQGLAGPAPAAERCRCTVNPASSAADRGFDLPLPARRVGSTTPPRNAVFFRRATPEDAFTR